MFVLYETPAGYAIFKVIMTNFDKILAGTMCSRNAIVYDYHEKIIFL